MIPALWVVIVKNNKSCRKGSWRVVDHQLYCNTSLDIQSSFLLQSITSSLFSCSSSSRKSMIKCWISLSVSVQYCFRYESWRLEVVGVEIMEVQDKLCICYSILITFITMLAGAGPGEKNMLNAKHETTLIFIKNSDHLGKHKSGKTSPNCVSMLIWRTFTWFWDIWLVGWIHSRWLFYFCLPRYSFESLDGVGAVDLSKFQVASAQPGDVTVSRAIFNSF